MTMIVLAVLLTSLLTSLLTWAMAYVWFRSRGNAELTRISKQYLNSV